MVGNFKPLLWTINVKSKFEQRYEPLKPEACSFTVGVLAIVYEWAFM